MKKNWPTENYLQLAERIRFIHPLLSVLGPAEVDLQAVFKARAITTVSNLELGELAAIAHLARYFIGNDSGVSHLAASAGARGLVIFGPTEPEQWRPLGDVRIIRKQPLAGLMVDQVWQSVEQLIGGND